MTTKARKPYTRKAPTAEMKAKAEARREAFRGLVDKIAELPETERAMLVAKVGAVVNAEGKPLSMVNTMMLVMQCPAVSMVGGFQQWIAAGRCVRKGEKGLGIWIPCGGTKDTDTPTADDVGTADGADGKAKKPRFIMGTVFDISQTEPLAPKESATVAALPVSEPEPDCGCMTPSTSACFVCGEV